LTSSRGAAAWLFVADVRRCLTVHGRPIGAWRGTYEKGPQRCRRPGYPVANHRVSVLLGKSV